MFELKRPPYLVDASVFREPCAADLTGCPPSGRQPGSWYLRVRYRLTADSTREVDASLPLGDEFAAFQIDLLLRCLRRGQRRVRRGGKYVALKPKEFELLRFLARHPGQVFTREQLLDHVWGHGFVGENRTVDVHVRWLREKIEASPSEPALIETVRGVGYRAAGGTPSLSHAEDREDPQATQDREASQTGQAT